MENQKESLRRLQFKPDRIMHGQITPAELAYFKRSLQLGQRLKVQVVTIAADEDHYGAYEKSLKRLPVVELYKNIAEFAPPDRCASRRPTARYADLLIWNGGRSNGEV